MNAAVETATSGGRPFDDERRSAAPLSPRGKALKQARQGQNDRGSDADLRVGRNHANEPCSYRNTEDRKQQRRLSPAPVTEPANKETTERPNEEAYAEHSECRQKGDRLAAVREEIPPKNSGEIGVNGEVVEFEDVTRRHRGNGDQTGPLLRGSCAKGNFNRGGGNGIHGRLLKQTSDECSVAPLPAHPELRLKRRADRPRNCEQDEELSTMWTRKDYSAQPLAT